MEKELSERGNGKICPVALIVNEDKILMGLRHYTPEKWKTTSVWTLPGGRSESGEVIEATLRREVQEETGITDLEILDYLGTVPGSKKGDRVPIFLCYTDEDAELCEPEKFSEWGWFSIEEFPENFINPAALELIQEYFRTI